MTDAAKTPALVLQGHAVKQNNKTPVVVLDGCDLEQEEVKTSPSKAPLVTRLHKRRFVETHADVHSFEFYEKRLGAAMTRMRLLRNKIAHQLHGRLVEIKYRLRAGMDMKEPEIYCGLLATVSQEDASFYDESDSEEPAVLVFHAMLEKDSYEILVNPVRGTYTVLVNGEDRLRGYFDALETPVELTKLRRDLKKFYRSCGLDVEASDGEEDGKDDDDDLSDDEEEEEGDEEEEEEDEESIDVDQDLNKKRMIRQVSQPIQEQDDDATEPGSMKKGKHE